MPTSAGQFGDFTLRRVGACRITVDPSGVNKVVGFTRGNLQLTITADKRAITVAEFGSSDADFEITGVHVSVTFAMVELSLKTLDIALQGLYPTNWQTATTNRSLGRSGIRTVQSLTGQGGEVGRGQKLVLHPIRRLLSDTAQDITLWLALIEPTGNWELSDQGDVVLECRATCVLQASQADGAQLVTINEPNAGA